MNSRVIVFALGLFASSGCSAAQDGADYFPTLPDAAKLEYTVEYSTPLAGVQHKDSPEYLEMPFPVKVGATWVSKGPEVETRSRVEAIENVELFDRTYNDCLKVSRIITKAADGLQVEITSYHAPGVGEVRGVLRVSGTTLEYVELNPPAADSTTTLPVVRAVE